jgi:hypothetical protein
MPARDGNGGFVVTFAERHHLTGWKCSAVPGESYSDVILRLARDPRGLEGQDPQRSSLVPRPSIARAVHGVGG